MTIEAFTISQLSPSYARISWTASNAIKANWLYMDGVTVLSDYVDTNTARYVDVEWYATDIHHIELHEEDTGATVNCTTIAENRLPDINFGASANAVRYKIYNGNATIGTIYTDPTASTYDIQCPKSLPAGWNALKVTAQSSTGVESTRDAWQYNVFTMLPVPTSVVCSGTGGVFSFTITA